MFWKKKEYKYFVVYETEKKKGSICMTIDNNVIAVNTIDAWIKWIKRENKIKGAVVLLNWKQISTREIEVTNDFSELAEKPKAKPKKKKE